MKSALTFLLLASMQLTINAQMTKKDIPDVRNKFLDIAYASQSPAQKLDVYLPDSGGGPLPTVIWIHGGAFKFGDKRDGQVAPLLRGLKRGYAIVSLNYRLSPEATWPAQINDCKAAVRWLRASAKKYRIDPDKIAVWGESAGGHLSAMLGTSGDVRALEDLTQGNADRSSRVQAVVDWYGPTDFGRMDDQLRESHVGDPMRHSVPDSPESQLLGKSLADAPELVKEADPATYVSPDDPPFFIQHGLEDNLVPYQGSVLLARNLGKALGHGKVILELLPATRHGGDAFVTPENIDRAFAFLDSVLKH